MLLSEFDRDCSFITGSAGDKLHFKTSIEVNATLSLYHLWNPAKKCILCCTYLTLSQHHSSYCPRKPQKAQCVCYVCAVFGSVCPAYRSTGAPWPLWQSVSVGGRNVAACPAGPELQDSPDAGSLSAQTVPSASCSACGNTTHTAEGTATDSASDTNSDITDPHNCYKDILLCPVLWFVFDIFSLMLA